MANVLLITASVLFASIVVCYSVEIMQQTVNMEDTVQMEKILELRDLMMNQTDELFNQIANVTSNPEASIPEP